MKEIEQKGRSTIEMLGVLAIIGVLTVGGIAGYSQAMSKYKINKTMDQVQSIIMGARTLMQGKGVYRGLENKNLYSTGVFNNEICQDEICANPLNPYGGEIIVSAPNNQRYLAITYNGLTKNACAKILMQNWGGNDGLRAIVAKGENQNSQNNINNYVSDGVNTFTIEGNDLPIQLNNAVRACQPQMVLGEVDGQSSITWIYR